MLLTLRWLRGARLDRCEIQGGRPTLCWGEKDGKPFAIVWNPVGSDTLELPVPKGLRIVGRQFAVPRWIAAMQDTVGIDIMSATPNPALYTFERITQQ